MKLVKTSELKVGDKLEVTVTDPGNCHRTLLDRRSVTKLEETDTSHFVWVDGKLETVSKSDDRDWFVL